MDVSEEEVTRRTAMPSSATAGLKLETMVAGIAVVTAFYYILSFAFEIGFFWRMGLELIPSSIWVSMSCTLPLSRFLL